MPSSGLDVNEWYELNTFGLERRMGSGCGMNLSFDMVGGDRSGEAGL